MSNVIKSAPVSGTRRLESGRHREVVAEAPPAAAAEQKSSPAAPAPTVLLEEVLAENKKLQALCEQLRADLQAQEAIIQSNVDERFEEAYRQGLEKAGRELEERYREQLQQLQHLAALFEQNVDAQLGNQHEIVVQVVFASLCKIFGDSFAKANFKLALIREAVHKVRDQGIVNVHVSPQDYALIEQHKEGLFGKEAATMAFSFSPDPNVSLGGCIIDVANGSWDCRLETQLQHLHRALSAVQTDEEAS